MLCWFVNEVKSCSVVGLQCWLSPRVPPNTSLNKA